MAKIEKDKKEIRKTEIIYRPLGIVEVWQEIQKGLARVRVPVIHKIGKNWWEFPGGSRSISEQSENDILDAGREVFEEIGLIPPQDSEELIIPHSPYALLSKLQINDKDKNRIIKIIPVLFRYAVRKFLPEISLNEYGEIEADDSFWIDMTPLYSANFRAILKPVNEAIINPMSTFYTDTENPSVLHWTSSGQGQQTVELNLSEASRFALGEYGFWIMNNIPVQAEFRGLRIE